MTKELGFGGVLAVTDDAILGIKNMIISGELTRGDRLPREADLAERLGLSRGSLREAVKALSVIRVLDVRQGDGTYVTSLEPGLIFDALSFVVDLQHDDTVLQIVQVRRIMESAATGMAAERIRPEEITELSALLDRVDESSSVEEQVANDMFFHSTIMGASGNPYLARLIDSLSGSTARARIWRGLVEGGVAQRTRDEHRMILDALAAGERHLAEACATVHVAGVEQWLLRLGRSTDGECTDETASNQATSNP